MARCSCGGGTCSCVIEGGTGILVNGAGSSSNPYTIDATGDFSGSIIPVPTDTVLMSISGSGTDVDPILISARATVSMTELEDVSDVTPPQEGEVPVWTVDHWEFKTPASAPPGVVNRGAGIIGDGSTTKPLLAAVSGIWGSGSMAGFPADTTLGTPVYVDSLGQLRARPVPVVRHDVSPITPLAGWTVLDGYWVQYGSMVFVSTLIRRTGATIPSNGSGNITDVGVGNLIAAVPKPLSLVAMACFGGYQHQSSLGPTGAYTLGGLAPNLPLLGGANGYYLSATATYIANTGVVL